MQSHPMAYMVSHVGWQQSSQSLLSEPQISHFILKYYIWMSYQI